MSTGTVKTVTGKGFGFIKPDDSDKDLFYHESNLQGDLATSQLQVGDKVTFDVEETPKGKNATNIALAE